MSEYLKKWKDSISSKTAKSKESISTMVAPYDFITRLNDLERWRSGVADPDIRKNKNEISQLFLDLDKTKSDFKNYVDSVVLSAKNELKNYADETITKVNNSLSNAITQVKNTADTALNKIQDASNKADIAYKGAIAIFDKLKIAANNLKTSSTQILSNGQALYNRIWNALDKMKNTIDLSISVINKAKNNLEYSINKVVNSITSGVKEIQPALSDAINNANAIPKYVGRLDAIGAVRATYRAIAYLLFRGSGGQGSVLNEMKEMYHDMSNSFTGLGHALTQFVAAINNVFSKSGETMRKEGTDIGQQTLVLSNSITNMGTQLQKDIT